LAGFFLVRAVSNNSAFISDFNLLIFQNSPYRWSLITFCILLVPVNWAFETIKWRYLIRSIEKVSFWEAYKGVITGVTFGLVTPHSLGDFAGRILQMKGAERLKSIGSAVLGKFSQFAITLLFGLTAIVYLLLGSSGKEDFKTVYIAALSGALTGIVCVLFFIYRKEIFFKIKRYEVLRKIMASFELPGDYRYPDFIKISWYSFLRYLVFTLQFFMLLLAFNAGNNYLVLLMGVFFVFFIKSVIPTFFDLGVREASALYFFSHFGLSNEKILVASLCLWAINILLPALAGMFLIFKIKIFRKQ
jgi:uncharacterized membrane protein YbhN (UPF0104 family)